MIRAVIALILIAAPLPAAAWSNQGHMATGLIAYDRLARDNPDAVAAIVAIMARHPDKARFDRNLAGLTGPARARALFMWMARWPDDIRDTAWDRPKWHYYGELVAGWNGLLNFHVGEADRAFPDNLATAMDVKRSAADRAVALCWLFHIAGDMHQPLHAGHSMDWRFPLTDRLGTIAWIRPAANMPAKTLHDLWDEALDRPGGDVVGAPQVAALAETVPLTPAQRTTPKNGAFALWTAESVALAIRRGYVANVVDATRDPAAAPVLQAGYLDRARRIARVRVAQAGERLAALLARLPGR